jgi:hypothetical protein
MKASEKLYTLAALCAGELSVANTEQGAAWTPAGVQLGGVSDVAAQAAESKVRQNGQKN